MHFHTAILFAVAVKRHPASSPEGWMARSFAEAAFRLDATNCSFEPDQTCLGC
jgi:hypothetical protein